MKHTSEYIRKMLSEKEQEAIKKAENEDMEDILNEINDLERLQGHNRL